MLPLLNAIFTRFTSTLSASFPSGLHRDNAPEGTVLPYVVSQIVSSKTDLSYNSGSRETTQIRFNIYGVGHDAGGALAAAFISAFDGVLLTLTSGTNDSVIRQGDAVPKLLRHDASGNDVWEWSVIYEYHVIT